MSCSGVPAESRALGRQPRLVAEGCRTAHVLDFGVAFHQSQAADQLGTVFPFALAVHRRPDVLPAPAGQTPRFQLHAHLPATAALLLQYRPQVVAGVDAGPVHPQAYVLNHRGQPRLPQIRRASEQYKPSVGAQVKALELRVARGVVAGQVVHTLLPEDKQRGQPVGLQLGDHPVAAGFQLLLGEMQRHFAPPSGRLSDNWAIPV